MCAMVLAQLSLWLDLPLVWLAELSCQTCTTSSSVSRVVRACAPSGYAPGPLQLAPVALGERIVCVVGVVFTWLT
ncbi:hypothetical protein Taro_014121 [Colocasia esculenta]|uniref:Secreted protein n=1 Tax=Colocasia esculenta TaxID=4460 RepID=A0A843UP89_COLES|nr:hypothetical protein [Colocasia esculenta]